MHSSSGRRLGVDLQFTVCHGKLRHSYFCCAGTFAADERVQSKHLCERFRVCMFEVLPGLVLCDLLVVLQLPCRVGGKARCI